MIMNQMRKVIDEATKELRGDIYTREDVKLVILDILQKLEECEAARKKEEFSAVISDKAYHELKGQKVEYNMDYFSGTIYFMEPEEVGE